MAKLKFGFAVAMSCGALVLSDVRFSADAHGVHRPRIGASHKTPTGAPETWGTYCITELAPLFREAIQLAQANQSTAPATLPSANPGAPGAAARSQPAGTVNIKPFFPMPAQKMTPQPSNLPLLNPLPPSLSAKPQETTDKMTIFVARKIVTMDPGWPTATAVAVKDGRILSVGTLEDLQPWMKRFPYEIDHRFAKQVIYPGFVEAHGHPVMGSVAISLPPLTYFPLRNPYGLELENMLTRQYFGQPNSIARIVHVADGATFQELFGDRAVEEVTKLRYTSNERLIFNGVKFYADDAFVSFGMELQYPGYIDNDRFKGLFMYSSKEAFLNAMRPWWKAGFQIHVHSNGSGGNQITLDALAALHAETPRFDHRFSFEHFGISSTAQVRQVKALGAVISTNPYYVSERADLNADYIGTDRASLAARMNTILKENIVLSLHSDTPVGVPSPLFEVWTAVNRIGDLSGKVHAPAERVRNVERAMRMVTVDAAYTLGVDDRVGSIEAGKYADFVVLDRDPQEVSAKTIKDVKVIATITAGRAMLTSATRNPRWTLPAP